MNQLSLKLVVDDLNFFLRSRVVTVTKEMLGMDRNRKELL
jgi:hypothetical protein